MKIILGYSPENNNECVLLGPERMTSPDYLSLYVRHWHPSTLTLDVPKEVVLEESTVEHLKQEVKQTTDWLFIYILLAFKQNFTSYILHLYLWQ